jgi:two-component system phosphate regulon response regulator PhoB
LILLDLMLPGMDGLEVCNRLRQAPETKDCPVIMLTAKGEEHDIVKGLELGADDYISKPFSPQVLLARVRAVMRRRTQPDNQPDQGSPIEIHDLYIHPGRNKVVAAGETVELTLTEFKILSLLATRPGWVFNRTQIIDAVHSEGYAVTDRAVDVQIVGLRKKLGSCGEYIETVRGIGYRFKEQ